MCYNNSCSFQDLQGWWNWQTRKFEGLVGGRLCGFKSHPLHHFIGKGLFLIFLSLLFSHLKHFFSFRFFSSVFCSCRGFRWCRYTKRPLWHITYFAVFRNNFKLSIKNTIIYFETAKNPFQTRKLP
jgi:hypothetical protein